MKSLICSLFGHSLPKPSWFDISVKKRDCFSVVRQYGEIDLECTRCKKAASKVNFFLPKRESEQNLEGLTYRVLKPKCPNGMDPNLWNLVHEAAFSLYKESMYTEFPGFHPIFRALGASNQKRYVVKRYLREVHSLYSFYRKP